VHLAARFGNLHKHSTQSSNRRPTLVPQKREEERERRRREVLRIREGRGRTGREKGEVKAGGGLGLRTHRLQEEGEGEGGEERKGMGEGDGEAGLTGGVAIPGPRIYSCCNCRCHVADHDEIISKCFQVTPISFP
jgi:hypothetical protein